MGGAMTDMTRNTVVRSLHLSALLLWRRYRTF